MWKHIQPYWSALHEAFGPVATIISIILSTLGIFQTVQQTFWPTLVIPIFHIGAGMISVFTLLSLIVMLGACLHHIVKLKKPSQKFSDAQKFLDKAIKKFEFYLEQSKENPTEFANSNLILDNPDSLFRQFRKSKDNLDLVFREIFKTRKELYARAWSVNFTNETNQWYEYPIHRLEAKADLETLKRMKKELSPFDIKDGVNWNDLLAHEI